MKNIRYSTFFGILTLISLMGGYIHNIFYSVFFSRIFYLIAVVFGILAFYWIKKEKP